MTDKTLTVRADEVQVGDRIDWLGTVTHSEEARSLGEYWYVGTEDDPGECAYLHSDRLVTVTRTVITRTPTSSKRWQRPTSRHVVQALGGGRTRMSERPAGRGCAPLSPPAASTKPPIPNPPWRRHPTVRAITDALTTGDTND